MKFLLIFLVFIQSAFANMPVITITGILPFDYFSSLFIYMAIVMIGMFATLALFTA